MAETAEFIHKFTIQKAFPGERGGAIRILIKASTEDQDRQGQIILKSAYSDSLMRDEFVREGYLDYNHLTDYIDSEIFGSKPPPSAEKLAELQKTKLQAIIGYPTAVGSKEEFPSEYKLTDDGFYILGSLIPGNQYAEEIRRGLEAGWNGWGASVSGQAFKTDLQGNTLKKIHLRKCAIQPKSESINGNTSVQLLKSNIVQLRDIHKSLLAQVTTDVTGLGGIEDGPTSDLQRRYDILYNFVKDDTVTNERFLEKIFTDISGRIYNQEMPLRSHVIRECLNGDYGIDGDVLDDMTDTFFIKLSGEKNYV